MFTTRWTIWASVSLLAVLAEGRRVLLKPTVSTEEPDPIKLTRKVLYYAEEPSRSEEDASVLIARQPSYTRAINTAQAPRTRNPELPRASPVQTIRNYNNINDDGSFTFGYEAADGSFKEETRGTDCVVRGKYGYIDPDGNKREFTYVSGNPCDPNAISQEEDDDLKDKSNEEENLPHNIPRRPNYALKSAAKNRPTTTLFHQNFNHDDSSSRELEDNNQLVEIRQALRPTVRTNLREGDDQMIRTTAKPVTRLNYTTNARFYNKAITEEPATTYRPQIVQFGVTPNPLAVLPRTTKVPSLTPASLLDDQFQKFQLESNVIPWQLPIPKPISRNPIYSTELVYDPASGQYNTIVYQQVPKFRSDININPRLKPYSQSTTNALSRLASSSTTLSPYYQQQLIQQHHQAALVQQSQRLYNDQLKQQQLQQQLQHQSQFVSPISSSLPQTVLLKQKPQRYPQPIIQRFPPDVKPLAEKHYQHQQPSPQFYYINPGVADQRQSLAAGQIEAFLRGHNLPL